MYCPLEDEPVEIYMAPMMFLYYGLFCIYVIYIRWRDSIKTE